ncbi:asparagine synthase glutamine-hydrolyzing AsnB10 [Butyrivibrio proteoclasticus B316]|uniref:asparagine synthase (glutamine-hydrolyzing) n=1 Tax=Butyrivibrio proteoclasticus (strain ATCC 51982 / DSM 14932 / B316) TaxID=515622 RepID=E0RX54_BUTPB|nr:asparagine synthase (glutamine-hydrolyzing) [Butyrivibrio proteoclasticus]ADL35265.1 asparagine synthase glutamine-hydrolyzing AsnB10 [Butyrivibrio proteoclasticus B316]
MCGICGYISKKRISEEDLRIMNDTMYHRGPNDSGLAIYEGMDGYSIGLAHRRLSILDLSPLGHQPMHSANGRISIVFNGEIYNFLELKEELSGYPYKSSCDTEVIIAAYLRWGIQMVDHIHGMFAIALYDRETQDVYLIRDRIGKKPLYYWLDHDNLVFASELKPIMKCPGFKGEIRNQIIPRYLLQQYIMAPDTIFKDVYKLEAGSILKFRNGNIKKWKYWDIKEVYARESADQITSYEEAKEGLKQRLRHSVAGRMIADVPLGTFLSGGYDSSLVTAIAQELSDKPVKTFCIGFDVPQYNEAAYAKEVAAHLGTEHTELYISEKEMFDLVSSIPQYYDEPFADNSEIPSMLVSKLAKNDVTVALSGDGGDEFFCGYNVYDNVRQAQMLEIPGAIAYGIGQLPWGNGKLLDKMPFRVKVVAGNRNPETKTQLVSEGYVRASHAFISGEETLDIPMTARDYLATDYNLRENIAPILYPMESVYKVDDFQIRRMLLDMDTYLPEDILTKMDRASMKYSLEARCPIMDTEVMEYSFRIPHKFKYHNGDKKHILKDIAYDYIPRELLDRPKTGFGVPMDQWLRGPLKEQLLDYSSTSFLKKQGVFDPDYVSRFINNYVVNGDAGPATGANYSKIAWSFYIFQQWYNFYML